MSKPAFPAEIPFDSILELGSLVRSGEFEARKLEAIQLAAWSVGCVATKISGSNRLFVQVGSPETLEGVCGGLEENSTFKGDAISESEVLSSLLKLVLLITDGRSKS